MAYDQQDGQGQTISAASYQRDLLGRTTDSRLQIAGLATPIHLGQSYNQDGQLADTTYPGGSQTQYSYLQGTTKLSCLTAALSPMATTNGCNPPKLDPGASKPKRLMPCDARPQSPCETQPTKP